MSWKDYFYFTKGQRIGLIVLISLIVFIGIFRYVFLPHLVSSDPEVVDSTFMRDVAEFKASLQEIKPHSYPKTYHSNYKEYTKQYSHNNWDKPSSQPQLFAFNPNELDSAGFIKLGLKPFMAHNILTYRTKGGKYKSVEQFSKLYGLSTEQFEQLKPYINIPAEEKPQIEEKQIATIELNTADTTELIQLKMPTWIAKKIIFYRKQLGGYIFVSQLNEIKNIPSDLVTRITPFIEIDPSKIQKIPINRASIDRMRSHPYINFYQANDIYEYRRNHGKYNSIEELKKIESKDITDDFLKKIEPYFDFSIK